MGLGLLARRACILMFGVGLAGVAGQTAVAVASTSAASSLEAPAVRQAIAHQLLQDPGPLVVSQGGSGGTGEPQAPAGGELLPSLSTANSQTWQIPHQNLVSRIYAAPVNYRAADGTWQPIRNQLIPAALGGYQNQANGFALQVPQSLSSGVSLSMDGRSVSAALVGGKESFPSVSGASASYREALTATDFQYESSSSGVKETATLTGEAAPRELQFAISASNGLQARQASGGAIDLVDGQGSVWFHIPKPLAYRAGADPGSGHVLASTLTASAGGWVLSVDTSAAWLREALATGAVAVDPSLEVGGTQNCWVESDNPTGSFCSQSSFDVGYQSEATAHEHHGLLQFSLASLPKDVNVLNAKLGLYLQSKSTSNTKPVGVYRVTKPWMTAASWEKYDGTHAWSTPGGDYSNPSEHSDASVNPSVGGSTGWAYWYPTKMVQEWANGINAPEQAGETEGAENDGLIVKDATDNSINNVLAFASIRASEHKPYLEVAYERRGVGWEGQFTLLNYPLTDKLTAGINVGSGNLLLENQDLQIRGRGLDFTSTRAFDSLDPDGKDYGRWSDSNFRSINEYGDGSVKYVAATGAYYVFIKKADGTYITPRGIKATFCKAGHAPCPTTLPSGVTGRLIFNQSQSHIDFGAYGWAASQADRHGNTLTAGLTEGVDGITSWTDTQGRKIEYKLTPSQNYYEEVKDITGARHVSFAYEGINPSKLIGYTDAAGHVTKYHYSSSGDIDKLTTPKGTVTLFGYDTSHRLTSVIRTTNETHTAGPKTEFAYYEPGQSGNPCEAKQKATVLTDPVGVKEREEKHAESEKSHTTTYCLNVLDEVEKVLDAEGHEAKSGFDPFGNSISSTAPARETGGSTGITNLVYGEAGQNLECEVTGTTSSMSTCPKEAMAKGYSSRSEYKDTSFLYQPTSATSPRQKTTNLCYWGGSNACKETSGEGESGASGELKQQNSPLTAQNTLKYTYNTDGTISSSTDADGHKTTYEYDAAGNLKTIVPPSGSGLGKTTITVDSLSRPHVVTQCLVESGGSCTSSQTSTLTYDTLDRVTEAVNTGPGATKTFKYTYDVDGNLEKRIDPTGTTNFAYDPLNRLTEEALPGSLSNGYAYDEASNLVSFTDAGGTTHYIYNMLNKLRAMYEPGGTCSGTPSKCTEATYDNGGSLLKVKYPSGATLNYAVDATTGRPTVIIAKNPAGETLLSHAYTYETGSHDTPLIYQDVYSQPGTATNTTTYGYDALDRLQEAITTGTNESFYEYELDGAGNRLSQNVNTTEAKAGTTTYYRYNSGNELECRMKTNEACTKTGTSEISGYSYDGAGNETAITGYSDPATTGFSYNNLSQLKSLTPPSVAEQIVSYLGSGQNALTGLGSTALQNSRLGLTKQTSEAGTSYYARTASGVMLDERTPGATNYNPIYDVQGTLIGLLSTSGGLVQTLRYGPYGENASASGALPYSATNDPFMFQGGYHVAGGNAGAGNVSNGLYHFGARYYDPTSGRWTQQDPVGQAGSVTQANSFGFVGDSPINRLDPAGTRIALNPGDRFLSRPNYPEEGFCSATNLSSEVVTNEFRRECQKVYLSNAEYSENTVPALEAGEAIGGAARRSAYSP